MIVYLYMTRTLGDELVKSDKIKKVFGDPIHELQGAPIRFVAGPDEYSFRYRYVNGDTSKLDWQDVWVRLYTFMGKLVKNSIDPALLTVGIIYNLMPVSLTPYLIEFDKHGNIRSREADMKEDENNNGSDET